MPNPDEVATLVVGGRIFDDFESIYVQDRLHEAFPIFRFTAAERDDLPPVWTRLQFKPGDSCAVYLGGRLAITGYILTRQTAYDANSHIVQLQGVGATWAAQRSSIVHKTGSFDGKSFEEFAEEVIGPTGVGIKKVGNLDNTPFQRLQIEPGQSIWDNLERFARPRGIIMGSDPKGQFVMIGEHQYEVVQELVEGINIKKCQAIITIENTRSDFRQRGSTANDDSKTPPEAGQQEAKIKGSLPQYSVLLTTAEQPVWNLAELQSRVRNDYKWNEEQKIECNITVYGWLRGSDLWHAGEEVMVISPMAMLNEVLKIETVTFTQDRESGTQTVLQLRNPAYLNSQGHTRVGQPAVPQAEAVAADTPADQPPAAKPPEPPPDTLQRMPNVNFWEPR